MTAAKEGRHRKIQPMQHGIFGLAVDAGNAPIFCA
jgi:hypothetical protein